MQLPRTHFLSFDGYILLLRSLTVAAHELIDTSCGVNEFALTCVERVRRTGDFDFYHWVSFAFELYCIIRLLRNISPLDISLNTTGR